MQIFQLVSKSKYNIYMTNRYIKAVACKYFNLCQNRNIIYVCVANNTLLLFTELFSGILMGFVVRLKARTFILPS